MSDNKLIIFNNENFGEIRTLTINEEPYFVAKDLAKILGYKKLDAMYRIIDEEDKKNINPQTIENAGFPQNGIVLEPNQNIKRLTIINESGLYSAIFGSTLSEAKAFKKWITSEVLPTIRKTGCYITESAVEESIDYQSKYGIRRIRKTFNESTDPRKTYEEYIELSKVEYKAKRISGEDRIKASKIIIDTLQDKIANEVQSMRPSELLGIQELVVDIQDDIIKLNNKRNGGLRSSITKKMNKLEDKYTELYEDFNMEDANYYEIPVHPFSNNYQYTYNVNTHKPVKTDAYIKWINKLHLDQCLPTEYPNLDTTKPIKISLGYICKPNFDTSNFSKSIIDEISKYYNFNDSLITEARVKRIDTCQEYYDGCIFVKLENVDD